MHRKIALIGGLSLGLLLSVATVSTITRAKGSRKVSVTFVNAEASYGPPFSNVPCERLAFAARNDGMAPVPFVVSDIKDEHGNWYSFFQTLDEAAAGTITHLYLYLPQGSHPQAVRLRGYKKASVVEKTQFALSLLSNKSSGSYPGKQVWF